MLKKVIRKWGVTMEIVNRKARYDYFIEDEMEAGIVLTGTEIKSIRAGKANIGDSYAIIRKNEIWIRCNVYSMMKNVCKYLYIKRK